MTMRRLVLVTAVVLLTLSCAQPSPPPEPETISNVDLGIALSGPLPGLTLVSNQGSSLEFRPTDGSQGGILWFAVGPEREGVNLVAAVQDHREQMEGRPGAEYMGGQELQGEFGTAFYSRGRFVSDGEPLEETAVFLIHPDGRRFLAIHYRYPAGDDSAARVEQLINVIGYLA